MLMSIAMLLIVLPLADARINSCALNIPAANQFDNGLIKLNGTAIWDSGNNLTNVTFTVGTSIFSNFTINGTSTNSTAGAKALKGDFTFTISSSNVPTDGAYTTYATCYNETTASNGGTALNSSSLTYTIDTIKPGIMLNEPYGGSTVIPNNDVVTFKYTPASSNLGNCSLHINNVNVKSSTSGTTSSNVSQDNANTFLNAFTNDNNSVRAVVECVDLAGLVGDSNNITFNVLKGAISPAVKALQRAEASGQPASLQANSGNAFNILGGVKSMASDAAAGFDLQRHLQSYGWMYLVGIILAGVAYKYRKRF